MSQLEKMIRLAYQLPFPWAGAAIAVIVVMGSVAYIAWRQGRRDLRALLVNWPVVIMAAISAVGFLAYYRYWGLPAAFSDGQIGIVVSEIPGDTYATQQNTYALAIRSLVAQAPELADSVRVRLLERPLPTDPEEQQQVALNLGRRLHATFVLRLSPIAKGIQPWLTIVSQPEFELGTPQIRETPMARIRQERLPQLDKTRLPADVVSLARCVLALSYYWRHMFAQAGEHFAALLSSNLPSLAPARGRLEFYFGNCLFQTRHIDEAISAFRLALKENGDDPAIYTALGEAAVFKGKYNDAIETFKKALKVDPDYLIALLDIGATYMNLNQPDSAIPPLQKAITLEPDFAEAHDTLGAAYAAKGQVTAAVNSFSRAITINPLYAKAYRNLGAVYYGACQIELAISAFEKSISIEPQNPRAHWFLGLAYWQSGQHDHSRDEFSKARSLDPAFITPKKLDKCKPAPE